MEGVAAGAVLDLVAAGGAVGDDQRVGLGLAHGGKQRELGHLERDVDGVGAVAERAGHAAAARFDGLDRQVRDELEGRFDRGHGGERFLVAVAVQQRALGDRLERAASSVPAAASRAMKSSSSSASAASSRASSLLISAGISSRKEMRQLGSRPTTGMPRPTKGASVATQRSASRRASSTSPTARNVRPQQSGRPRRLRQIHAVTAGGEHGERGRDVLRLEIAVEGVGEQHHRAGVGAPMKRRGLAPAIGAPARQVAAACSSPAYCSDHCRSRG